MYEFLNNVEGTNEGELSWYLGVRLTRISQRWTLSQEAYIDTLLKDFGMMDAKPCVTPMLKTFYAELEIPRQEVSEQELDILEKNYRKLIGTFRICSELSVHNSTNASTSGVSRANRSV